MTIELIHVLVMYVVCGKRVEARVRSYSDGHAVEEASIAFSQDDLQANAVAAGRLVWDETDILAVTGCDHWLMDKEAADMAKDVADASVLNPPAFVDATAPAGSILEKLTRFKQLEKQKANQPDIDPAQAVNT